MTNHEIKELISILKKEGCNSKKQAIEYLEGKLGKIDITKVNFDEPKSFADENKPEFEIGQKVRIIDEKDSYFGCVGTILSINDDVSIFLVEHNLPQSGANFYSKDELEVVE